MSQISLQSEAFLQLYARLAPIIQRLIRERSGPQRVVAHEMEAYFPGSVAEVMEDLRSTAQRAIDLLGPGVSQVALTGEQTSMIQWTLARE